jgi:uncharacterized membrane protein YphA (DoxX/SURF4 family)
MAEPSRGVNIAVWVISALLCALYLFAGTPKLFGVQAAVEGFRQDGYSDAFRLFIGAAEWSGGVGLLIPRLATWAAIGLMLIMVGALHLHLSKGEYRNAMIPLTCLFALAFSAWLRRSRALFLS